MSLLSIYFGLLAFNICTTNQSIILRTIVTRDVEVISNIAPGCFQSDTSFYCNSLPKDLPINVTRFYMGRKGKSLYFFLEDFYFYGENWNNLKVLHLDYSFMGILGGAMRKLKSLEKLHISAEYFEYVAKDAFFGLDNLKVLSLSGGNHIVTETFTRVIADKRVLSDLETLSIKNMVLRRAKKVFKSMVNIPSKTLNMNFITTDEFSFIRFLWFPNCSKCPDNINISYSTFSKEIFLNNNYLQDSLSGLYTHGISLIAALKWSYYRHKILKRIKPGSIKNLKVFDASYIYSPMIKAYVQFVLLLKNKTITLPLEIVTLVSRAEIVNISGIYLHRDTVKLKRLSVHIVKYFTRQSPTRELTAKDNHLQYLDVAFLCNESKLEKLDLSSNVIEFIQPNMCPCCTRLFEINLSSNNLFKMANRNYSSFEQLISSYQNFKSVQLSLNKLTDIPTEMFHENIHLEQIDLSNNFLTKISFNLRHILNLKTLNLRNNRISTLDRTSFTILQFINAPSILSRKRVGILKMNGNPIMCSKCKFLPFLKWLTTTPLIDRNGNNMLCKNHEGIYIHTDQEAVDQLQEVCDKPKWIKKVIILSSVIPTATTAVIVISICLGLRYRRHRLRKRNIEEKMKLIQLNQLDTKFVVFLSYSSEDTDFLNKWVYNPLKIHLQEKFQTERDIICLGDRHFKLGKPINDEMVRSLQESAVVLILLTRNFCGSEFCRMEFDHALFMKKPFVIMVKGEVDINEMVPSLQEIFKRNTRLLWEKDGDNYLMKTSWDNVSSSILELI